MKPEVLFSEKELEKIVKKLAKQISRDYKDKNLLVICVLKGAVMFTSDLLKHIECDCKVEYVRASSYCALASSGNVKIFAEPIDVSGYDVLIVDDIVDTGNTQKALLDYFSGQHPKSLKACCLLSKQSRRECDVYVDYIGETVSDCFVVGYGFDYLEKYRNLPFVACLVDEKEGRQKI